MEEEHCSKRHVRLGDVAMRIFSQKVCYGGGNLGPSERCGTKLTAALRTSENAVAQVLEKMVGDTGIEPVASSV
ncbi:MAG: hypothetical protein K0S14_581 [Thermomicrobiales bacterium]|nr:hypothetical protein [Thermomicrobiales bacterium]MDF2459081.1 hypothetical protein [Nitrospira sp.]